MKKNKINQFDKTKHDLLTKLGFKQPPDYTIFHGNHHYTHPFIANYGIEFDFSAHSIEGIPALIFKMGVEHGIEKNRNDVKGALGIKIEGGSK